MSTRGFVGFVADDTEKIAYNHFDSYPGGLGVDVLAWLREATKDAAALAEQVRELHVVDPDSVPSDDEFERLRRYYNGNVGGPSARPTWYQLLRETQGKPGEILAAGFIEDGHNFPADSLFAEWGYVVDVDGGTFEAYRGFQREPHDAGRFANRPIRKYGGDTQFYPVALVASWPLDNLPDNEAFVAALEPGDADEE